MDDVCTYQIQVRGRVDLADLNAGSPVQMQAAGAEATATRLAVETDQSGLIGLIRHLNGRGVLITAVNSDAAAPDGAPVAAPTSRRRFLQLGGLTLATAGLTLCGVIVLAPDPPPLYHPSFSYGGNRMNNSMNNRVLVAYASATGSTVDVAAALGETLGERGLAVDVRPITEDLQPQDYDAVLIGSAVQYGTWLPEAIKFVEENMSALDRVPVALFCVHIQNGGDDESSRRKRAAYLDAVRPLVGPVAEGFFMGRFNRRGARLMLPGWLARFVPALDFRNWTKIRAWAESTGPLLVQQT
jgi:menaquinone-dependent protoporphyrinogen oxidase